MATVFSTLTAWLNMLAGFPMRKMAFVVPEGMGLVPGLLETAISEARGDKKVTKWIKLLLQRGRVAISLTEIPRSCLKSFWMNSRCRALWPQYQGLWMT